MNLKFRLLLLLIAFKQISAQDSQVSILNQQITLEAYNEPIYTVLKRIEKQTGKRFSYDSKIIDSKKKRTVSFKEKTLSEVISVLFDKKVKCKVAGNSIVLYKDSFVPMHADSPKTNSPVKKAVATDSRPFLKPSKTRNDTMVRYFIDIIVPNSVGKDSIIRTESIEVPSSHILQVKNDTTLILLKKDSLPSPK